MALQAPGTSAAVSQLTAPSVDATDGVTLGGQTFGDESDTGMLGGLAQTSSVGSLFGVYSLTVPAGSAVMLTLH